jgi:hypothetical protein
MPPKVSGAAAPEAAPLRKTPLAPFAIVKVILGVVVGVATLVVNIGERLPAETDSTVPPPDPETLALIIN